MILPSSAWVSWGGRAKTVCNIAPQRIKISNRITCQMCQVPVGMPPRSIGDSQGALPEYMAKASIPNGSALTSLDQQCSFHKV